MGNNRSLRPVTGKQINFTPPKANKHLLKNGSKIFLIKKDELPVIRLHFIIECGSKFDHFNKRGTSNLTALCIDEGAGKLNALELADEFELLGARFSVHSNSDVTIILLQVLAENFIKALDLFSSVILSPHFKENDFNREKRKIQTRIEQIKDEPDHIADIAFDYFLFGKDNPYSFPVVGTPGSLKEINVSDVRKFYGDYFTAGSTSIIAVGSFNEDEIIYNLEERFKDWQPGTISPVKFPQAKGKERKIYLIPKKDSVQTEIRIGHPAPKRSEKDYFQKLLLNLVLGGQFSSRLNLNLREKHGYTYGIQSRFNYYKDDTCFTVSTSVSTENTKNTLREVFSELRKIRSGINEEELKFAKSSIIRRFPLNFETYSQIASNFESKVIHNLADDYFETYIRKIADIRLNELNAEAENFFDADSSIVVLVGEEKSISEQIADADPAEVIKINFEEMFPAI